MAKQDKDQGRIMGSFALAIIALVFCLFRQKANSTPPYYHTINREQKANYTPDEFELLKIWIVYVGQGDGILIQLPPKYNYDNNENSEIDSPSERIDILVDGGSFLLSNRTKMREFIKSLYNQSNITVEHAVITHHDSDHITGLTTILKDHSIGVENIYHNGLASYSYKGEIIEKVNNADTVIAKKSNGKINRVLATVRSGDNIIEDSLLIKDIDQLQNKYCNDLLHGVYKNLAKSIIEKKGPSPVNSFNKVTEKSEFIDQIESARGNGLEDISFAIIWPPSALHSFGNWGETVNGNSVTFRLKYKNFEMLFTGDHNEKSEELLLKKYGLQESVLICDVLKAPHHGSSHNLKEFFVRNGFEPVITVASMGEKGFNTNWKHPSTDVIKWSGRAHRFYSTYIHERKFKWSDMTDKNKLAAMVETKHILIETDGIMFRIVEVDLNHNDLNVPPSMLHTRRGDGTRWIDAKEIGQ